uniref:Uncharacterized protein n=1 Tax=viral metagenome TaxID=1070528 RepID=A0A6M3MAG1_9ZZZZ
MAKKKIKGCLRDSKGNRFIIKGFTHNRYGKVNGFALKGTRGEKEIAISDLKHYKICER